MTDFLGLPVPLLLLLPLSLALGVDLFLTLLIVTASLDLGWGPFPGEGVPAFRWGVMGVLLVLYLLEAGLELRPLPALIWHNLQLLLRPLAGILLAVALLAGESMGLLLLGAIMAGAVAGFSHVLSWGEKLSRFLLPQRRVSSLTHALLEDTLVLAFALLAVENPSPAFVLGAFLLLMGLLTGGPMHHLTRFGTVLFRDRLWGLASPVAWVEARELPAWIRVGQEDQPIHGFRGLRCGARKLPGTSGFRDGWLLESGDDSIFAFRGLRAPVFVPLEGLQMFPAEAVSIALRVPMRAQDGSEWALFLQKSATVLKSHK